MEKRRVSLINLLWCIGTAALLLGCATPSLEDRKSERLAAYDSLSPALRATVDAGAIAEGMDTNAVYIAWGKPTRAGHEVTPAGEEIRWEYWQNLTKVHPYWSIEPGPGGYYATAEYRPTTSSWRYLSAWAVFQNGRLTRWSTFPRPSY
jgi:hypothetical protein